MRVGCGRHCLRRRSLLQGGLCSEGGQEAAKEWPVGSHIVLGSLSLGKAGRRCLCIKVAPIRTCGFGRLLRAPDVVRVANPVRIIPAAKYVMVVMRRIRAGCVGFALYRRSAVGGRCACDVGLSQLRVGVYGSGWLAVGDGGVWSRQVCVWRAGGEKRASGMGWEKGW